jgi:hypothetical protein
MHIESEELSEVLMQLTWIKMKVDYQESSPNHVTWCHVTSRFYVNILCLGEVGCLTGQLIRLFCFISTYKAFE